MYKTRFLVSLLSIFALAGTFARYVPSLRPKPLLVAQSPARLGFFASQHARFSTSFLAGDFHAAGIIAERGYRQSLDKHDLKSAASFLANLGSCRFALHQYKEALQSYLDARKLADDAGEIAISANLNLNISSVYFHLRQMDAALASAQKAMGQLPAESRMHQLPAWLLHFAAMYADQDRLPEALKYYAQGILAAERAGDAEMAALGWNNLGYEYLEHHQLSNAEYALLEAYRIRKLYHLRSIEGSYRNLGMLRLQQRDVKTASRLLDLAVERSRQPGGLRPAWDVYHARGLVRLAQRRLPEALGDLRIAVRLARTWRRSLPGDATRVSTENFVQTVHASLVEAGNQLYFRTGNRELAKETFEAAEANRADSLRALLAEPHDWRRKLTPEYWQTLRRLESAEVDALRASAPPNEQVQRLRGELIQMEIQAGSNSLEELPDLMNRTRRTLRPGSVLLSFHLSEPHSYLWAISRERFELYQLAPASEIAAETSRFTAAMRRGEPDLSAGARVYRILFGKIDRDFRDKPQWLLALDAQLFELPFAALLTNAGSGGRSEFLIERHSLQVVSGAGLLGMRSDVAELPLGPFLGIADPIYNVADRRWTNARPGPLKSWFTAFAGDTTPGDLHLARLVNSGRETAACGALWGGPGSPILLEGAFASRQKLREALNTHPAVIHFAAHIVKSGRTNGSGLIVLSLAETGRPQVLGPAEIATWNLNGALVSLSGCSSGSADALAGTGLMGLTRACQSAGARAVVASLWPTPDDSGSLFLAFYRFLRASPLDRPAIALQRAQIAMLRSSTWRASPVYWGAYFITGNRS